MIFADKLIQLRKKAGWSQEELAEQIGVSRQAISKWEGAQSVPDLSRIIQLSKIFNISTDILLKDENMLEEEYEYHSTEPLNDVPIKYINLEEVNNFLEYRLKSSKWVSLGVMLCIVSPILLITLSAARDNQIFDLTELQVTGIGVVTLMLFVGISVSIFVYFGIQGKKYEYLEYENFETEYGVDSIVKKRREEYKEKYIISMVIGILLCVLSCIPIFLTMIFSKTDFFIVLSIGLLLLIVATGTMLIVKTNIIWESYSNILQENEFSKKKKANKKRKEFILGMYWMIVIFLYLLISFITVRWDKTWIVWPIAGVGSVIIGMLIDHHKINE